MDAFHAADLGHGLVQLVEQGGDFSLCQDAALGDVVGHGCLSVVGEVCMFSLACVCFGRFVASSTPFWVLDERVYDGVAWRAMSAAPLCALFHVSSLVVCMCKAKVQLAVTSV